ncbi:MetS family NSS transporter small subunit [Thalassobacillus sp. CUG 92003]|nr:MetS family NSS transporter small subunit [Thalassobacillus sp. CUG 92003]
MSWVIMFIFTIIVVWGGLALSITNAVKKAKEAKQAE